MSRRRTRQAQEIFSTPVERPVVPIAQAYVNLILAIRSQAMEDRKLQEWQLFWEKSPEMKAVWRLLKTAYRDTHKGKPTSVSQA